MNRLLVGAIAGAAATVPMTVVMKLIHWQLPRAQREEPIPPRQITMQAAETVGVRRHLNEPARQTATLVSHLGYGAGVGAIYGTLAERLPGSPAGRGALFGLAVWSVSYLGWLPAAGVLPSATRWPAGRNLMMIAAHLVWGAVTGIALEQIARAGRQRRTR